MKHITCKTITGLCMALALLLCAGTLMAQQKSIRVLMVGGGSSHDFNRWYKGDDAAMLEKGGLATVTYTDDPSTILGSLAATDVLLLTNNQPIRDSATRKAIFAFVNAGKGLVLAHAALWYNWADWPMYNYKLVSGGSRGHEKYGPFTVTVNDTKHPVTRKVPKTFTLDDELYYFKPDPAGPGIKVLATSKNTAGVSHPALFVVNHPKARIVGFALGHDAAAHELEAYQTILRNAVKWAARK